MTNKTNYVALVAGILSLVLVAVSWFVPWWQITIGNPGNQAIASVNFSPVNFNFSFFTTLLTVPIIWALNIASLLTLLAGGIALVVYAVMPAKSYSKKHTWIRIQKTPIRLHPLLHRTYSIVLLRHHDFRH